MSHMVDIALITWMVGWFAHAQDGGRAREKWSSIWKLNQNFAFALKIYRFLLASKITAQ